MTGENCPMGNRTFAFMGSLAMASGAMALSSGPLAAQAPAKPAAAKPAAAKPPLSPRASTIRRTADGHPDLQGTYDVATMTPVERPSGVKSLTLTKEEAAALDRAEATRQRKNDAPA